MEPGVGINLIVGENASGKTSLLEAIHFLSRGRTFRSKPGEHLIRHGCDEVIVTGRIHQQDLAETLHLGVRRSRRDGLKTRIQGRDANGIAELAEVFPVLVLHPESQSLLTGSPAIRRAFLDWGGFYVEDHFLSAWRRYQRALSQRNTSIRCGERVSLITAWNTELSETTLTIDRVRTRLADEIGLRLGDTFEKLFGQAYTIKLNYRQGWKEGRTLTESLDADLDRDRKLGNTHSGPHRAELDIEIDGEPVAAVASRGQVKTLTIAMIFSLAEVYGAITGRTAVLLVDDLPAELDQERRARLMGLLSSMPNQAFITTTDFGLLRPLSGEYRMFHVEQGRVSQSDNP